MPRFLADTSCLVAALQPGHQHRDRAVAEISRRLDASQVMAVAGHSLVEVYSVLTRMPPPYRVSPAEALASIQPSIVDRAEVVALNAGQYVELLQRAAEDGVAGGRIYDAAIAACAVLAKVDTVLTFNERHFRPLLPDRIRVVVPSE